MFARSALVLLLVAGACSNGVDNSPTTTLAAVEEDGSAEADTFLPTGDPVNRYTFKTGDCFNYYNGELFDGRPLDLTTKLPCEGPHEAEVYFQTEHPAPNGTPYPGVEQVERFGLQQCYEAFEGFVGQLYELSELEIGLFFPRQEDFEDDVARYRTFTCYVYLRDDSQLSGSMRATGR